MGPGSHFLGPQESCPPQIFGSHMQDRKIFKKIGSVKSKSCTQLPHACREVAQPLTAGTCKTACGVAFPNMLSDLSIFIAEQQYSAPFPTHRMLLVAEFKFTHSFAFVQVAYQHFNFLNNSSCPRLHAAYRIHAM